MSNIPIEKIVLLFQEETDKKNKDKLFKEITRRLSRKYDGLIKSFFKNFDPKSSLRSKEEVRQQLLITTLGCCNNYKFTAKFNTYLWKCLEYTVKDLGNDNVEYINTGCSFDENIEDILIEEDFSIRLDIYLDSQHILQNLAEHDKIILEKKYLEGKTFKEVGTDLNQSPQAISQKMQRIKNTFKKKEKNDYFTL